MSETRVQTVLLGVGCLLLAVVAGLVGSIASIQHEDRSVPYSTAVEDIDLSGLIGDLTDEGKRVRVIHRIGGLDDAPLWSVISD